MIRKLVLCLAMLLLSAAPVSAAVTISASVDGLEATVSFVNSEPNHVRAFAFDLVVVSGDANIVDVCDVNGYYKVHPGSFAIVDGNITGDVVCSPGFPGTEAGLDTNAATLEMGSLYIGAANAPPDSGNLFKFIVDGDCTVDVCENVIRAGVVMENPDASSNLNLSGVQDIVFTEGCYFGPDTDEWATVGSPDSWCTPRQCHGDADGILNTYGRGGALSAWVEVADIDVLTKGFRQTYSGSPDLDGPDLDTDPDTWIAADFDHILNTYGRGGALSARVEVADISILVWHFRDNHGPVPTDCQTESPTSP